MSELSAWRTWWVKRRWYERNRRLRRRWRINRHMARAGAFIRYPVEGEVLEALDSGRLRIGASTLFEPGCWLTLVSPDGTLLVTAGPDGAALVWDVHGRAAPRRPATAAQLAGWWEELSGPDAAKAHAAMTGLRAVGPGAVALIRDHLSPVPRPDAKQLVGWVSDLDSDVFKVRERASRELERLGESATAALQKVETAGKTEEARARARRLLEGIEAGRLREERAVEVLEMIGDAVAREVLTGLAGGEPAAPLTQDAARAATRLGR